MSTRYNDTDSSSLTRRPYAGLALLAAASLSLAGASMLAGCEKEPKTAGEALDKAVEETGDAIEEAGDAIGDALDG